MPKLLDQYKKAVGEEEVRVLRYLAADLKGLKVIHVNSTYVGGGVAEILNRMIPLMNALGLKASWEVITGDAKFFNCTKSFHNSLQGNKIDIPNSQLKHYERVNKRNALKLKPKLEKADVVIIHDPQPAAQLKYCSGRKGKWIWRCHIDLSNPYPPSWKFIENLVKPYDASIFSLSVFTKSLPHPQYLMPPSIDPLSQKNIILPQKEVKSVYKQFGIDVKRPVILQVSRYDRFKDPIGVIRAYRIAKHYVPSIQLVLCGGTATDDPEGMEVLRDVKQEAGDDPDIHILLLEPKGITRTTNALQWGADIILQKSTKEGFGLTVTEAMWKGKPLIGGDAGGIRLQVVEGHTGYLVRTPEGAAHRILYLLKNAEKMVEIGRKAKEWVRENYLITRHLREYLTMFHAILKGGKDLTHIGNGQ